MSAQPAVTSGQSELHVLESAEAVARHVAEWMLHLVEARGGQSAVCLSGGSTPRRLYEVLASPAIRPRFPWSDVHWFFGDERLVPDDHPDSNFRMVREALFSVAPIPGENIHPVPTQGVDLDQAAQAYETTLKQFHGSDRLDAKAPLFDLTLLGIGDNGHTASLFPGDPALDEQARWAVGVPYPSSEPRVPRVTLTYPALDSSRTIAFLATGAGKREIVARTRGGDRSLPATAVQALGVVHWFVDRAAAPSPDRQ
jgi:6-phosphogluconolactonase